MKLSSSSWIALGLGLVFVAGPARLSADDRRERPKDQPSGRQPSPGIPSGGGGGRPGGNSSPSYTPGRSVGGGGRIGDTGSSGGTRPQIGVPGHSGGIRAPIGGTGTSGGTRPPIGDSGRSGGISAPIGGTDRPGPTRNPPVSVERPANPPSRIGDPGPSGGIKAPSGNNDRPGGTRNPAVGVERSGNPPPKIGDSSPSGGVKAPSGNNDRLGGPKTSPGGLTQPGSTPPKIGGTDRPVRSSLQPGGRGETAAPAKPQLSEIKRPNGEIERRAPSGAVREKSTMDQKTGAQHIQQMAPTGRIEKETVRRPDGTTRSTSYDLGRREKKVEVVHANGRRETTDLHYNRRGEVRSRETIHVDLHGAPVSRTVVVQNNFVLPGPVVVHEHHRHYRPCRFGFAFAPLVIAPAFYAGWYDPFWYGPPGVVIASHSFHYSWGWNTHPWYGHHRYYWDPYPVYVSPSYWVTDWMVGSYIADSYAVRTSVAQTREEVRLAREEAEKARLAAQQARDEAEIAEARAAQALAEARAERAEARAAKAELAEVKRQELGDKPNPNAKPIDKDTKEDLKNQIEKTIAEQKAIAEQTDKGGQPVLPDVSAALADPKRIFPVSRNISVITRDDKPAGILTAGDLLRAEPGQQIGADAKDTDFVLMKVMTSKGEDDEVPAGTVIKVSLKDLQEFDNEFRAKLEQGMKEADARKDEFKKSAAK